MAALKVGPADYSSTRQNAIEDARNVQKLVEETCSTEGHDCPPYILSELIGKGSFGRVYKAYTKTPPRQLVAIKIISIEEGDSFHPGASDTFRDILHEVNTLKLLNESGAKNINVIVDTLLVGQSIWVITEYCAGGSVSTLMKPTKGLAEKWIIPILRETAVALHWIHKQSIIHRDIKCANILVTEDGHVQLCDFGVAGIIDTRVDKRSTVTGTLQWMAPEFFDSSVSYGIEVDIWAFGSTAFEMAVGLPPNAMPIVDMAEFGQYLKQNPPRLEAEQYSLELRDLISCCMVQDPGARPPIEHIQQHPYIANTELQYPTSSLQNLVHNYRTWEAQGGSRLSLFSAGGAQAISQESSSLAEDWDFDTMRSSYGSQMSNGIHDAHESHPGPLQQATGAPIPRRRQMPAKMKPLVTPLERVFNPNTLSNYDDNARAFYIRHTPFVPPDLPLRAETKNSDVRESLIDLDAAYEQTFRLASSNQPAQDRLLTQEWRFPSGSAEIRPSFERTTSELEAQDTIKAVSAPTTEHGRAPIPEWKFPMMPASSETTSQPLAGGSDEIIAQTGRQETIRPTSGPGMWTDSRASALSLIDLDASLLGPASEGIYENRPSTAISESASVSSTASHEAFPYEQQLTTSIREPSIYVSDDIGLYPQVLALDDSERTVSVGTPSKSASNRRSPPLSSLTSPADEWSDLSGMDTLHDEATTQTTPWPAIPSAPSASVLLANSSPDEMKQELLRMVSSLKDHLNYASDVMNALPVNRGP